jgi:sulfotransferase
MPFSIQFISGLPRSGTTLLAGILRQNPRVYAAMSSPVAEMFAGLVRGMTLGNEFAFNVSDETRVRVLRGLFQSYYGDRGEPVIFDTSRGWCAFCPTLAALFPKARIICCIRNPAWVIDSIERYAQSTNMVPSKMFGFDTGGTVYSRAEIITKPATGVLGYAISALRQAWFGEHAGRLIAIRYESLTRRPSEVMARLYEILEEPRFEHDFENVEYAEPEFDRLLGLPGFHTVQRRVEPRTRETILPSDLFQQHKAAFWEDPRGNPRGVLIL